MKFQILYNYIRKLFTKNSVEDTNSIKTLPKSPELPEIIESENTTKINHGMVLELLITSSINNLLIGLQKELEEEYSKMRELENRQIPHTAKHKDIINKMHQITQDLTIINKCKNENKVDITDLQLSIKKQLRLTSHKFK